LLDLWRATSAAVLLMSTAALTSVAAVGGEIAGRVVTVADGDTLTVLTNSHKQVRVRLAEIDAPERAQPWGRRAKAALSALVFGRSVRVQTRGTDQYGRVLGRVYIGNEYINAQLVRSGAAWAYRDYLTDYSLRSLEMEARKQHQGLWSVNDTIVPPWEWRHGAVSREITRPSDRSSGYRCGSKRCCRQMVSCEEARYYMSTCGISSLDGDHDGTPCETLCR
jgi:endonuclease YncB( thermonuclease family)